MTASRKIGLSVLVLYTVFAVTTFIMASAYWYAGCYFIALTVIWFKLKRLLTLITHGERRIKHRDRAASCQSTQSKED